jgi:hypothetical protein
MVRIRRLLSERLYLYWQRNAQSLRRELVSVFKCYPEFRDRHSGICSGSCPCSRTCASHRSTYRNPPPSRKKAENHRVRSYERSHGHHNQHRYWAHFVGSLDPSDRGNLDPYTDLDCSSCCTCLVLCPAAATCVWPADSQGIRHSFFSQERTPVSACFKGSFAARRRRNLSYHLVSFGRRTM